MGLTGRVHQIEQVRWSRHVEVSETDVGDWKQNKDERRKEDRESVSTQTIGMNSNDDVDDDDNDEN